MENQEIAEIPIIDDNEELEELKRLRREFHQHPELGWTEFWTTARIAELLEDMGFDVLVGHELYQGGLAELRWGLPDDETLQGFYTLAQERLGENKYLEKMKDGLTGLVAHIRGGEGGPGIGFRFDIDGLPILESAGHHHQPTQDRFSSPLGTMHACGHDGHVAMGLGLAKRVCDNIDSLTGDFYFMFQPSEESARGGFVFSRHELVKKLDHFVALHLGVVKERKLVCDLRFLSSRKFEVTFRGRSAHAALSPQEGKNALLGACTAVVNLYSIPRHSSGLTRLNVGQFHSANAKNVISELAGFQLDVRGENEEICDYMVESAKRILKGAAEMYALELELCDLGFTISTPASPGLKTSIRDAALKAGVPGAAIVNEHFVIGCEDAPFIMKEVQENRGQAAYICLGSPTRGGHHNPEFDFDEDLLIWGVHVLWELALDLSSR